MGAFPIGGDMLPPLDLSLDNPDTLETKSKKGVSDSRAHPTSFDQDSPIAIRELEGATTFIIVTGNAFENTDRIKLP